MNSAGFWRFATIGTIGICAVLIAAIVQLGLVNSATSIQGNNLTAVKVVREANFVSTSSTSYVNVPGASTMITVPAGKQALIIVRFAASSACSGTAVCLVRVLVGGAQASPASSDPSSTLASMCLTSHKALSSITPLSDRSSRAPAPTTCASSSRWPAMG
jgi:hypothetical protein